MGRPRGVRVRVTAIAVATLVAAWGTGRRDLRRLALVLALGIPAQAVIGGVTVLTDLNPWVVSFHLLCSLAIIGLAVLFLHRLSAPFEGFGAVEMGLPLPLPCTHNRRYAFGR